MAADTLCLNGVLTQGRGRVSHPIGNHAIVKFGDFAAARRHAQEGQKGVDQTGECRDGHHCRK